MELTHWHGIWKEGEILWKWGIIGENTLCYWPHWHVQSSYRQHLDSPEACPQSVALSSASHLQQQVFTYIVWIKQSKFGQQNILSNHILLMILCFILLAYQDKSTGRWQLYIFFFPSCYICELSGLASNDEN